jgi:hypothetical protein
VFGALAVLGVALMVMAAVSLPETLPAGRRRLAGVRPTLGAYREIIGDRRFILLALVTGLSFGAMFSYVSGSSFVSSSGSRASRWRPSLWPAWQASFCRPPAPGGSPGSSSRSW